MRRILLGLFAAAVVFGTAVYLRGPGDDGRPPKASEATPRVAGSNKASSEMVLSIAPGSKRAPLQPESAGRVSPLIKELRSGAPFKPIFDRLKAVPNPSAEEMYVMATMLEGCADVVDRKEPKQKVQVQESKERFASSLSPKAPDREKRIAAFEKAIKSGCDGFDGVKTTRDEIRTLLERAAAAGDPKAQGQLLTREIEDQRRDANGYVDYNKPVSLTDDQIDRWKRIVASGDPRAMVDVITLFNFNADIHLRGPDEAPIDSNLLYYASTLAACDLGYPCGPDSPLVAGACAFQGRCDSADYRDYLLFYELAPGNSQLVIQYRDQLMRVVRDGDWSYFTFQRGPAPINSIIQRR